MKTTIATLQSAQFTANETFNSIHPIQLTPSARIWKKLKTKHEGIVMVFQSRGFRNDLGRISDVLHDNYICYGSDAVIINQVMGSPIYSETSSQKIEIDNVEVLACFDKVTTEALEKAGYKVNWINPANLVQKH